MSLLQIQYSGTSQNCTSKIHYCLTSNLDEEDGQYLLALPLNKLLYHPEASQYADTLYLTVPKQHLPCLVPVLFCLFLCYQSHGKLPSFEVLPEADFPKPVHLQTVLFVLLDPYQTVRVQNTGHPRQLHKRLKTASVCLLQFR